MVWLLIGIVSKRPYQWRSNHRGWLGNGKVAIETVAQGRCLLNFLSTILRLVKNVGIFSVIFWAVYNICHTCGLKSMLKLQIGQILIMSKTWASTWQGSFWSFLHITLLEISAKSTLWNHNLMQNMISEI